MITVFPTEWKVIQNSQVPVTTNQIFSEAFSGGISTSRSHIPTGDDWRNHPRLGPSDAGTATGGTTNGRLRETVEMSRGPFFQLPQRHRDGYVWNVSHKKWLLISHHNGDLFGYIYI